MKFRFGFSHNCKELLSEFGPKLYGFNFGIEKVKFRDVRIVKDINENLCVKEAFEGKEVKRTPKGYLYIETDKLLEFMLIEINSIEALMLLQERLGLVLHVHPPDFQFENLALIL